MIGRRPDGSIPDRIRSGGHGRPPEHNTVTGSSRGAFQRSPGERDVDGYDKGATPESILAMTRASSIVMTSAPSRAAIVRAGSA
jgi:hypothetical protein